ncbi:MAG: hypothetical protein WC604_04040 [Candidatus Gracilibacteria bacterium]
MNEKTEREITPATQARTLKNGERVVCNCDGKLATVMGCIQSTRNVVIAAMGERGKQGERLFIAGNTPDPLIDNTCKGGQEILRTQKACAMEGLRSITEDHAPK